MAVNPMELLKYKQRLSLFQQQHPKVREFMRTVKEEAIEPGTILELKVTTPEGKEYVTNIRMTAEDVETIHMADSHNS